MLVTWLSLMAGNFLWAALRDRNFLMAAERSWFQGAALVAVVLVNWLKR